MSPAETYRAHLHLIDDVITSACRRRAVYGDEGEDFRQVVHLKLLENDCARIAKHRGDSSLRTYLVVVINQIFLDELRRKKGRWRPSAMARRLGPTAVKLETLTSRDRFTFEEAVEILLLNLRVPETRSEITELWERLPNPVPRTFVNEEDLPDPEADQHVTNSAQTGDRGAILHRLNQVLESLRASMGIENWLILKLIFFEGRSVIDTAKSLDLQSKALYRQRDRVLKGLRRELEAADLGWEILQDLMGWSGLDLLENAEHPAANAGDLNSKLDSERTL